MKYKLKNIFDLQMGKTPSRNNTNYWNTNDYEWISIADLSKTEKYITDTKEYLSTLAIEESGIKVIPANTVVMSFKLSIGKTAITGKDMYCNEAIMAFHDKHVVDILPEYIYYMFKYRNWDNGSNKAVMGKTLNKSTLSEVEIDICSIEKQKEIVTVLDKVMESLSSRKKELALLDELVRGRFVELFGDPELNPMGWEKVTLNDVCSSIVRGPFGSALKKEFFVEPSETTYKVYEQKHAIQKSASIGTYYITQEKYRELKRFECLSGDILMSCSGTMGELYQLPEGCEKGIINQALCKFTLNDKILPVCFLVYMQQTIGKLETKGSGIQNIAAVSYIKQMPINLPPMEVQKKFERFVKQIDKSKFRGFSMLTTMKSAYEQQTLIYP